MPDWILIQTNFPNKCVECGESIDTGDSAYWKKGTGLKHYPQCPRRLTEDDSRLVIIDPDDPFL